MKKEKTKKPFYKRTWFIVLAAMCVLGGVMNLMGYGDDPSKTAQTNEPVITSKANTSEGTAASSVQPEQPVSEAPAVSEKVDNYGYTEADHEIFKQITKEISAKHLPSFKDYPESWVFVQWDDEAICTSAKYDVQEITHTNVPQEIICVFSYNPADHSYTSHFFGMGETIYETDGYADEGIEALVQLGQMVNQ